MLSKKSLEELKEHLEKAQNPLFYYDNDADGLCSYVLLRKFLERGKGVAVRSFPDLNKDYARKAMELEADYVFVLDKPVISEEFVEAVLELGIPLVIVDHHDVLENVKFENQVEKGIWVYNSARQGDKKAEPVNYICYKLIDRKEFSWVAMAGCVSDHFLADDLTGDFKQGFPEFWINKENFEPFDVLYGSEIGKIALGLNFGLKDSTTNVIKLQNFLIAANSPEEVFEESSKNREFLKKYNEINDKYEKLLKKARENVLGEFLFFEYSGDMSISSEISNRLSWEFPEKYIVVAYKKQGIVNISLRGKGVKGILEKVLLVVEGSGGGHEDAVGARISFKDLPKFKEVLEEEIGKLKT
jgi:single-stranded DNA-specific DHH superfamily exonuclease